MKEWRVKALRIKQMVEFAKEHGLSCSTVDKNGKTLNKTALAEVLLEARKVMIKNRQKNDFERICEVAQGKGSAQLVAEAKDGTDDDDDEESGEEEDSECTDEEGAKDTEHDEEESGEEEDAAGAEGSEEKVDNTVSGGASASAAVGAAAAEGVLAANQAEERLVAKAAGTAEDVSMQVEPWDSCLCWDIHSGYSCMKCRGFSRENSSWGSYHWSRGKWPHEFSEKKPVRILINITHTHTKSGD